MQLLTLSRVLAKRPSSPSSTAGLDPVALILDSLPGSKTFSGAIAIFTQAVRNPVQRLLGFPIVLLGLSLLALSYGNPPVLMDVRQRLNSPELLPLSGSGAGAEQDGALTRVPRLYIASKADVMSPFDEVLSHIEASRRAGIDVRAEIFESSNHVSHAKEDPERYWTAVKRLWRDTQQGKAHAKL